MMALIVLHGVILFIAFNRRPVALRIESGKCLLACRAEQVFGETVGVVADAMNALFPRHSSSAVSSGRTVFQGLGGVLGCLSQKHFVDCNDYLDRCGNQTDDR